MAFVKKTWVNRNAEFPGRRLLTPTGNPNEFDVARSEGTITTAGDNFNADNMNDLENRISSGFAFPRGTWNPSITTGGGTPTVTYTKRMGEYYRIGDLCFVSCVVGFNCTAATSGIVRITNLPATASAETNLVPGWASNGASPGPYTYITYGGGQPYVQVFYTANNTSANLILKVGDSQQLGFSGCYLVK
jgi:hypothetical protein